ncbi:MAG: YggS family pyridoxal phosphate-dependent enzyme [Bacteroidetes bacterium]|nr:YggS family pyridoxal phosphate-dependent enzyme [Bacteroidota bacterium]
MTRIANNIKRIKESIGAQSTLIVVSKYRSIEEIGAAFDAGHRAFAENRVQALLERVHALPPSIEWHLIGHLQRNKVKYIVPFICMIHSVDSLILLQEINLEAQKLGRIIPCLIQIHIAKEEGKFGLPPNEIDAFFGACALEKLEYVQICGLMAMATFTEDKQQIEQEFMAMKTLFLHVRKKYFPAQKSFKELSMGMSSDYELATKHGSTIIRVGSAVFG